LVRKIEQTAGSGPVSANAATTLLASLINR
jgi:hypothetical protein